MNKFSCLHSSFLLNVTWSTHKILLSSIEPEHFFVLKQICISLTQFFFFKLFICTSALHYIPSTFLQKIEDVLLRIYTQREWSLHNVGEGISIHPLTLWNKKKGCNCVEGWTPSKKILKEAQNFASSAKLYWQARCEGRWWKESELSCRNTADCGDPAL